MIKHISPISGIATHQGKYVLTAGYDNQLILWDAEERQSLARGMHDHLVNQCAFSQCGTLAVSSSSDYSVRLWELPSMRLKTILNIHEDDVEGIAFHSYKPWIASCSRDKTLALYDLDGQLLQQFHGHEADVISVAWQGKTDILISSSDDGTIKRWDTATGKIIENIDLGGIETDTIAITTEGIIYAGNDDGEIIIISEQGKSFIQAHDAGIKRLVYDNSQNALVSLSYDRKVKIWDCDNQGINCVRSADLPIEVWPRSCAFLDKDNLVFVTFGSSYAQYNIRTEQWQLDHIEPTLGVNAVCQFDDAIYSIGDAGIVQRDDVEQRVLPSLCNFLTPLGQVLITGGQTGEVFDAISGQRLYQHRSPLNCGASFQRDGQRHVIVGTYTGEGLVFKLDEQDQVVFVDSVRLHENAIKGICVADGIIFSVCADSSAAFTRVSDFSQQQFVDEGHQMIANGCDAALNGDFVSVSRDLKLRIWNSAGCTVIDSPHKNSIKCVAISADGDLILSANYAGFIGVYKQSAAKWIKWSHQSHAGISSITRTDSGDFLASSYDGKVHFIAKESLTKQRAA